MGATAAVSVQDARLFRLVGKLYRTGGFTFNPREGHEVTNGFAVSVVKDCEERYGQRVTVDDVRAYAFKYAAEFVKPGNMLGAWVSDGVTYLDVSTVVYDREKALRLGRDNEQIAVYDLARGIELRTGYGTPVAV